MHHCHNKYADRWIAKRENRCIQRSNLVQAGKDRPRPLCGGFVVGSEMSGHALFGSRSRYKQTDFRGVWCAARMDKGLISASVSAGSPGKGSCVTTSKQSKRKYIYIKVKPSPAEKKKDGRKARTYQMRAAVENPTATVTSAEVGVQSTSMVVNFTIHSQPGAGAGAGAVKRRCFLCMGNSLETVGWQE